MCHVLTCFENYARRQPLARLVKSMSQAPFQKEICFAAYSDLPIHLQIYKTRILTDHITSEPLARPELCGNELQRKQRSASRLGRCCRHSSKLTLQILSAGESPPRNCDCPGMLTRNYQPVQHSSWQKTEAFIPITAYAN